MPNLSLKQKIMIIIGIIGAILIAIFSNGLYSKEQENTVPTPLTSLTTPTPPITSTSDPQIISTNPSPLEEAIVLPSQTIEITFNIPLENVGEFKNRLDPKLDYLVKLSDDRKTAKITPTKAYNLGTSYTLFILPDSKFDGKKTLGKELIYHFKTIDYRGV